MQNVGDVIAVTEPIEVVDAGDRLLGTFISGQCRQTFAVDYHKAITAAHLVLRLAAERERAQADRVSAFPRVKSG